MPLASATTLAQKCQLARWTQRTKSAEEAKNVHSVKGTVGLSVSKKGYGRAQSSLEDEIAKYLTLQQLEIKGSYNPTRCV